MAKQRREEMARARPPFLTVSAEDSPGRIIQHFLEEAWNKRKQLGTVRQEEQAKGA